MKTIVLAASTQQVIIGAIYMLLRNAPMSPIAIAIIADNLARVPDQVKKMEAALQDDGQQIDLRAGIERYYKANGGRTKMRAALLAAYWNQEQILITLCPVNSVAELAELVRVSSKTELNYNLWTAVRLNVWPVMVALIEDHRIGTAPRLSCYCLRDDKVPANFATVSHDTMKSIIEHAIRQYDYNRTP